METAKCRYCGHIIVKVWRHKKEHHTECECGVKRKGKSYDCECNTASPLGKGEKYAEED
jgi:hypothetical protein